MSQAAFGALSGDCSISTARERHDALVAAFPGAGPVGIDVSGVTQADVSFVQLLASAARTAAGQDRPFQLVGVPDALAHTFQRSGVALDAETGRLTSF